MSSHGLEVIDREECEVLLTTQRIGRVGLGGDRPGVFPVLYALLEGDVVFRTAPGDKLIAAALEREIVFEVDSFSTSEHSGWSVNVLGVAAEILHPAELGQAQALDLPPWAGEVRDRYVRIRARDVSGRRILRSHSPESIDWRRAGRRFEDRGEGAGGILLHAGEDVAQSRF